MQKLKFDARQGRTGNSGDMHDNPWKYSFAHNFKVHFKRGILQALANKLDITVSSATPEMPSTNDVMTEFNQRMKASIVVSNTRGRYSDAAYHVTPIEYKESFAFYDPQMAQRPLPMTQTVPAASSAPDTSGSVFCRHCGASLPADSRFCNKCGTQLIL